MAESTSESGAGSQHQLPSPPAAPADLVVNAYAPRVRRRNRVIASCLECRRRKLKCSKTAPCTNCTRFKRDCLYLAPALDSASQQKLSMIKEKMGSLEQSLERDVARKASTHGKAGAAKVESDSEEDDGPQYDDEKDLEPTPFAAFDQVYEEDADDDLMDLGVQFGKLRVSERIGGFFRPKFADELGQYPDRRDQSGNPDAPTAAQNYLLSESPAAYLGPGPDYIAPASGFFFPGANAAIGLQDYLPTKPTCDRLLEQYWEAVHPVVTIVHKPTFLQVYQLFWRQIMTGAEPPASTQSVVFAALFMSAVSLSADQAMEHFGTHRATLIDRLQSSVETSLSKANFLRTTKLDVIQAFVMYLVPLCRAEVSRAHSALTGTAIRLAECMGLHREPTLYGFSAVETHVRRLIWYHLCFLDIRTIEATGPRAQIHKENFDTRLPLNINEDDLLLDPPPTEDSKEFTDMTLSRLRFELTEAHRQVWIDNARIDAKKLKHSAALAKVQKFKADIEARYFPLLQGNSKRQTLALHFYRILSYRMFTMILHRFFAGTKNPMPDRLRGILMDAILATNEFTMSLDTRPELSEWAWYRGALSQYHSALLLVFAVYAIPNMPDSVRIWNVLDYVFELPNNLTTEQKADSIIFALRDRLQIYQSMRKMRASKSTEEAFKDSDPLSLVVPQQQTDNSAAANTSKASVDAALAQMPRDDDGSSPPPAYPRTIMAWNRASNYATTTQMDATQFVPPPLVAQGAYGSISDGFSVGGGGGGGGGAGAGESRSGQNSMQIDGSTSGMSSEEIDWAEFENIFPTGVAEAGGSVFPGTDVLADLNLGSWTPFVRHDISAGKAGRPFF